MAVKETLKTFFQSFHKLCIINIMQMKFNFLQIPIAVLAISLFAACSSAPARQEIVPQKQIRNTEYSATDPAGLSGGNFAMKDNVKILSGGKNGTEFIAYGEGSALPNEAPKLAQDRAEKDALSRAIKATGVNVSAGMFDLSSENSSGMSQMVSSYANVWSEAVSQYDIIGEPDCRLQKGGTFCRMQIKGKMSKRGDPDPDFKILKASLNQPAFYGGDELNLTLKVSRDCYITLLNIDSDGNITVVFPNGYAQNSFVKAGQTVNIPGDYNFNLNPSLPKGSTETTEILHIIATKNGPFMPGGAYSSGNPFAAYPAGKLSDMAKRLAEFPRNEWTAEILPYGIKSR